MSRDARFAELDALIAAGKGNDSKTRYTVRGPGRPVGTVGPWEFSRRRFEIAITAAKMRQRNAATSRSLAERSK